LLLTNRFFFKKKKEVSCKLRDPIFQVFVIAWVLFPWFQIDLYRTIDGKTKKKCFCREEGRATRYKLLTRKYKIGKYHGCITDTAKYSKKTDTAKLGYSLVTTGLQFTQVT
jgi:hypothetical protein